MGQFEMKGKLISYLMRKICLYVLIMYIIYY